MILERVRLKNIKSFVDEQLYFSGGINIIAGRNGTGKSTVIEAVGLALFDCWPQRFKDGNAYAGFIRRGEREGLIEVDVRRGGVRRTVRCELGSRMVSGRERIDYERTLLDDSGSVLASSGGRKKEFQEDIREHILGAARIDDDKLFRDIIGTEQGGFDEPFTRTEQQRRTLFEKILGIEDFQDFEKQFWSLVRMEEKESTTLDTRVGEHADLPQRVQDGLTELERRRKEHDVSAQLLKAAAAVVTSLRAKFDALTGKRESLQKASAERAQLEEKLRGETTREKEVRRLAEEAKAAAGAVLKALPGHEAYLAAEKELNGLRAAVKERDDAKDRLASLSSRYAEKKASLQASREAVEKQLRGLAEDISELENARSRHGKRVEELREEYLELQKAQVSARSRADFAREVSACVRDLDTVQRTLDNAGERVHTLSGTLSALEKRQRELSVDIGFFPRLADESRSLFTRYGAEWEEQGEETPFSPILRDAEELEQRLQVEAAGAADALSAKKEEGKGEKKLLADVEKRLSAHETKRGKMQDDLRGIESEAREVEKAWEKESGRLNTVLTGYADLDARIGALESRIEEHRAAHDDFLKQNDAAETLEQRERALADLLDGMKETRSSIGEVAGRIAKLEAEFSEEEYADVRGDFEQAQRKEQKAAEEHSGWSARVEEQLAQVKDLRKQLREYERLRERAEHARVEAAFTSDVHHNVVRELARHVGASIVAALSGFADELYQRIAPEQGARLHWDTQSYAVELHRDGEVIGGRELSGGQLMGVSLAVKLALIKWYAQCRIGFLDEPTTHLDRDTRAHLAEVIKSLDDLTGDGDRWFDQLFVISHEESFQGAGHRIELERGENGVSMIAAAE